jgi:hypothetical protein
VWWDPGGIKVEKSQTRRCLTKYNLLFLLFYLRKKHQEIRCQAELLRLSGKDFTG